MVPSTRGNRLVKVIVGAAVLLVMTLAWSGVSIKELLNSVLK